MNAGTLNRRITIQQLASGQDALGQMVQTWTDVALVWANIRYANGSETIKADAETSVAKASIRIRYRTGLNAGMRVLYGTTVFNVLAVLPDEAKHQHVDLACERVS